MRLLWSFLAVLAIASARSLGRDRGEELASLTLLKQAAVEKVNKLVDNIMAS